jgi:predicted DNA-binding protein with PD1-like motif
MGEASPAALPARLLPALLGVAAGVCLAAAFASRAAARRDGLRVAAVRLAPGVEIKGAIAQLARDEGMAAGVVLTCVGSCEGATVRLAAATAATTEQETVRLVGKHEIVSLVGTCSADGSAHLHVALADAKGVVVGGHLVGDMHVFTTAEVVLADCEALRWTRTMDDHTGFRELCVQRR